MITNARLDVMKRAAATGRDLGIPAQEWADGIEALAKADQRVGEPFEAAFARVTAEGDGRAFLVAQREAEMQEVAKAGRPRTHEPVEIIRSTVEKALTAAALEIAKRQGVAFETAFVRAIDTEPGRELLVKLRTAQRAAGL